MNDKKIIQFLEDHLKLNYSTLVQSFIENHKKYGVGLSQTMFRNLINENNLIYPKITFDYGCTKGVIMIDSKNYVLKIPICNSYDEADERFDVIKKSYILYNNNNDSNFLIKDHFYHYDYCAIESKIYDLAKEIGFDNFFCKTEHYYDIFDCYPIYKQEKALIFCNTKKVHNMITENEHQIVESITETNNKIKIGRLNYKWIYDCIEYYGFKETIDFLEFLSTYELNVDLHSGNIGYINNRPVLVDYSGV